MTRLTFLAAAVLVTTLAHAGCADDRAGGGLTALPGAGMDGVPGGAGGIPRPADAETDAGSRPASDRLDDAAAARTGEATGEPGTTAAGKPAEPAETHPAPAASERPWDTRSDTWVGADSLGRTLPTYEQVGPPCKDRHVGLFYFLWHGAHVTETWGGPYDISRILAKDPEAMSKPDSPLWGPLYAPHHWGESLFGYYLSDDVYVLRKHAQMLSGAGIDTLIFDVTNRHRYRPYYMALLRVFSEVRREGGRTPQVAFLTPFAEPAEAVEELYDDLYGPGLYPDLWFRWEDKPLILADPGLLGELREHAQQDTPAVLQSEHTLGQSFTMDVPFDAVGARFPNFATRGAAVTLTLYRNGPNGDRIAAERFTDVADNAWLSVRLPKASPAGDYYLEASSPQGTIGWWSHSEDVFPGGRAFADGAPAGGDRTLRIAVVTEKRDQIRRFFTFRKPQPDYFLGPTASDMWSWLEVYPQHVYRNSRGQNEEMSVGVAQNAVGDRVGAMTEPGARGRSYHRGHVAKDRDAVLHGYNVAEQWDRALKEDPQFIFITGWNEWFAGRFGEGFMGLKTPVNFVDAYDQENSRDIEPMKGGYGDLYYCQMANYVRRFKGVREPPAASDPKTIDLDDFTSWEDVRPEYRDDIGDPARRDHPGYNNVDRYVNTTGRNDLVAAKVARDEQHVYFYARPAADHLPP